VTPALDVRDLSAGYGPLRVLHDVNLSLMPGERVGLLGLNGHGKTTLLRAIVGLAGWCRGEIRVGGELISGHPTHTLARRGVVMIPQGDALFPGLTVRENLDSGAYPARAWRTRKHRREFVLELFPRLGERLAQTTGTLSGGERRMLSIGRGLMGDADVYLIDEPSLGLAHGIAAAVMDSLFSIDLREGAMILAEQNRPLIEGRIDRILHMHVGEIVRSETVASPVARE
jgi:branched-chain amino acid transport system ATP-binding protein